MSLHVHDYRRPHLAGIVDGAVLMHREMATMLLNEGALPHDLARGPAALAPLLAGDDRDTVYAGSGPYAYLYHLWRERHGGSFRIVREVHTTFWSGYWTQEELCGPLLRDGDLALFPSEYTRQVFVRCFSGLGPDNSAVAYPMLDRLPRRPPVASPAPSEPLRIGYLGALSAAKNFDQVLGVFSRVYRASGGLASLTFAGKPNEPRFEPARLLADLSSAGIRPQHVTARGVLRPDQLDAFFRDIDVLLFPSTASRESLGRVLVEALAHGVPVLAADIGPAVELLPVANLLPTTLRAETIFTMGRVEALGRIHEDVAADLLLRRAYQPARLTVTEPYRNEALRAALAGSATPLNPSHDRRILEALRVDERAGGERGHALECAERLFMDYYQRRDQPIVEAIEALERADGAPRPDLRAVVTRRDRNLADYRAFPKLLDALVLAPLTYRLGTVVAPAREGRKERGVS
ncbi:glycosyltransferase [Streptomyces scopuliridis]|uniref:glycosyltransferase n=1 Tax=Streptomyces scopuliridis TaxID=452529 RepID=UPI00342EF63A